MVKTKQRINDISEKLCQEFITAVPLKPQTLGRNKKLSESEVRATSEAALQKFYTNAREARDSNGLGIIGRARVAFALQQRLLNAGYSPALVKQVLFAMLTSVFIGNKS